MIKKCAMVAALMLVLAPGSARADWLFTPSLGTTFGGSSNGEHFTYGAAIGWMGAGIFGWEADFSFTPEFFEAPDNDFDFDGGNNVSTAMFNAIIGIPVGGQTGGGFRPYVTGGAGLIRAQADTADEIFDIDNNDFGINVGVGAIGFFSDHIGIRGDVRYFRGFSEDESNDGIDFDLGDFDFWRATGGVTFRW